MWEYAFRFYRLRWIGSRDLQLRVSLSLMIYNIFNDIFNMFLWKEHSNVIYKIYGISSEIKWKANRKIRYCPSEENLMKTWKVACWTPDKSLCPIPTAIHCIFWGSHCPTYSLDPLPRIPVCGIEFAGSGICLQWDRDQCILYVYLSNIVHEWGRKVRERPWPCHSLSVCSPSGRRQRQQTRGQWTTHHVGWSCK